MDIKLKLRESLLREFGEGEGLPFRTDGLNFTTKSKVDESYIHYDFKVPNEKFGDYNMTVGIVGQREATIEDILKHLGIEKKPNCAYLEVAFESDVKGFGTINRGDVLKIMNTIKSIVVDVIKRYAEAGQSVELIYGNPSIDFDKGDTEEKNRRKDLYSYFFNKFMPDGFKVFELTPAIGIYKI